MNDVGFLGVHHDRPTIESERMLEAGLRDIASVLKSQMKGLEVPHGATTRWFHGVPARLHIQKYRPVQKCGCRRTSNSNALIYDG